MKYGNAVKNRVKYLQIEYHIKRTELKYEGKITVLHLSWILFVQLSQFFCA